MLSVTDTGIAGGGDDWNFCMLYLYQWLVKLVHYMCGISSQKNFWTTAQNVFLLASSSHERGRGVVRDLFFPQLYVYTHKYTHIYLCMSDHNILIKQINLFY